MTFVNTRSSDCGRPGSLLKSIPSSNFAEKINFMLSARVLRAGLKALWQGTRWQLKAQRPNLPNFSPPIKKNRGSGLPISTIPIQYSMNCAGHSIQTQNSLEGRLSHSQTQLGTTRTQ